ncbi:MAG: hypothetical protein WEB13_03660 [Dehalococcoidia bacterium]
MNAASLPYSLLILLVELAVGSLAMVAVFDGRRQVTAGYVKAGALTIVPLAVLAVWLDAVLGATAELDGYALQPDWGSRLRVALVIFLVLAIAHLVAALLERHRAAVVLAVAGSASGVIALGLLAALIAAPTWSYALMLASVLVGAGVLGAALMAMMWGHWYLTSGRLPKESMEQMALIVFVALVVQGVLVAAATVLPAREVPLSEGFGVSLGQNPAYWLRVGVGLVFPAVLAVLAWRAAQIRGMMSATGLLYIALGAVLAGEVLARGLLFSTGLPL